MVYNSDTAERVRQLVVNRKSFAEKVMFGGVGFLLNGNMCVGVWKDFLILRVGREQYKSILSMDHTLEFDITGRSMRGWVMIEAEGFATESQLRLWIDQAVDFVRTLPKK